jgi:hypothetical protein
MNNKVIYLVVVLCLAFTSVSCAKKNNNSESSIDIFYINNHPFWFESIPKGMSPSDVVEYTKNNASMIKCADLFDSRYDSKILVKVDNYKFLNKNFKINFYYSRDELYAVSLVGLNEVSFSQSLNDAKKYIQFFSDKFDMPPKVEQENGFITSKSYIWRERNLDIGLFITMIESDTAVFTITFTNTEAKNNIKKPNTKYLKMCRQTGKKDKPVINTRYNTDPAIPPHSHPIIPPKNQ